VRSRTRIGRTPCKSFDSEGSRLRVASPTRKRRPCLRKTMGVPSASAVRAAAASGFDAYDVFGSTPLLTAARCAVSRLSWVGGRGRACWIFSERPTRWRWWLSRNGQSAWTMMSRKPREFAAGRRRRTVGAVSARGRRARTGKTAVSSPPRTRTRASGGGGG
jgi:hypothetical protein